jgi:chromate reductase
MGSSLLLVSGSLRHASTRDDCVLYDELAGLPHFNPDEDQGSPPPAVARLRAAVHRADGVMFSTPEYAGVMPGALKNLLEWLIGDDQPGSIYEKPVGWINTSPRGAHLAQESLRTVLQYAHARLVDAACGNVAVSATSVGEDGLLSDDTARAAVNQLVGALRDACGSAGPSR